ncbi:potassium channel family protein [Leifsonia sp. Leaf264]|uniref:potassium channel family protein n=1 Tax=Leifsonia sp. Leaf264 TaxID=1736314 RepID=UPI00138F839F|nr:potassium channel family protein [Leifsonia sp. Leaf264]
MTDSTESALDSDRRIDRRERWEAVTTVPLVVLGGGFILFYSLFVLLPNDGEWLHVLVGVELLITWVVFLIDYLVRLLLTPRALRWRFVRGNPIDLLSVILPLFRALRVLVLLRQIPYFRDRSRAGIRAEVITYAAAYAIVFVYFIALATLHAERDAPGATITTFGDAIWWAIVTVATVGYGDTYPVTFGGRAYAVLLMVGGIAIVGTSSAVVISYLGDRMAVLHHRVEVQRNPDGSPAEAQPTADDPILPALSEARDRLDDSVNRFRIEE